MDDPFSNITGNTISFQPLGGPVEVRGPGVNSVPQSEPPLLDPFDRFQSQSPVPPFQSMPPQPRVFSSTPPQVSPFSPASLPTSMPVYELPVPPGPAYVPALVAPEPQSISNYSPEPTPTADRISYADAKIQEVDITRIVPNPYQPRKVFDHSALRELADSIAEHGVIQPLVVTKTANGYELVVGERRFRASQLAGMVKVPVIVKEALGDQTKLEVALIENIQRQELNPIEEAQAYDRLMKTFKLTQDEVAKKVGKSRPAVANTVRLLNLPAEIQRGVIEGKVSEGHARAILGLGEPDRMLSMYHTALEEGWNVRQVEAKVRELAVKKRMDAAAPDPKLMALEGELRSKLGTQVKIQRQGRGGKITIEFFSEDELFELVGRMAHEDASSSDDYLNV